MNKSEKDRRKSKTRRRKPKQTRGQQTCERILEAARLLFAQRGYEATTTHQVAQRAGISVGGLYRYFGDKEAILKEVYEQEMSALRSRILAIFVEVDLFSEDVGALVAKVMKLAFEAYKQDAGLLRVLGEQSRKIPELARPSKCRTKRLAHI
jgi:AcrR family transcriptional regulator